MFTLICELISGIGVFIFALFLLNSTLNDNIIKIPASVKKRVNNPFFSFFGGLSLAILTQSSSAINSAAVQFSDKNLLDNKSAYFVVMGTNIGTTITAYIALLSNLNISSVFASLIFITSIILMIAKDKKIKYTALFISYFSLIFVGLRIISGTVPAFGDKISTAFTMIKSPITVLLLSILITAICQSSSLVSVIVVTLTAMSAIPLKYAMFMIIGANVGTCSTALLVSLGKSKKATYVALFNLIFNFVGLVVHVFLLYTGSLDWFINLNVAKDTKIALYHTFFNMSTALIILPFVLDLDKLSLKFKRLKPSKT